MKEPYKIIFLNQRSGTMFQEMAKDVAHRWHPSAIWTEVIGRFDSDDCLVFRPAPGYNRKNTITRLFSWMVYFVYVWVKLLFQSSQSMLFIVTMPPILGMAGYLLKKFRRQKYVILVFDIHPDLLIKVGGLKAGWIIKAWRRMNSLAYSNAEAVFTIGNYMAQTLMTQFDVQKTTLKKIGVVQGWADVDWLKPIPKNQNPFIQEHHLEGKFLVMYSGNIGATHDIETLIEATKRLKDHPEIRFVIIGDGAKRHYVVDAKQRHALENLSVLPYVPQEQLPYSLSAADIAVISMESGTEGFLIPSRTYSCLSVGNAIIAACEPHCELAEIVQKNHCGTVIRPRDPDGMVAAIIRYYQDNCLMEQTKANSRRTAVEKYSRKNSQQYIELLEKVL